MSLETIAVNCTSETGRLRDVIIGYPDNFHEDPSTVEIVNSTQAAIYNSSDRPTAERAIVEFKEFEKVMSDRGIKVYKPKPCNVPDQLTPRDIGFVIGDTFFRAGMARDSRKEEWKGIEHLIGVLSKVVNVPDGIVIEGGDIVVDRGHVYVGISQRTNMAGFEWLRDQCSDSGFQMTPVLLKGLDEGEDCLHLDCVFVPIGQGSALIYPAGMSVVPDSIRDDYKWIEVTKEEQVALGTNVLSLSETSVIIRESATRIGDLLERIGLEVIPLKFDEAPKTGGSFRCCTLTLVRD